MCKVAYVIGAYGGRSQIALTHGHDRLPYLRTHIEYLTTVKHSLDAIIIVINTDGKETSDYTQFVNSIPAVIQDTPVFVLRRPNEGISYGAYVYAFEKYVDAFDYFIIIEDDWLPIEDHFDTTLVRMLRESGSVYVCMWVCYGGYGYGEEKFAGITHGIITSDVIKKIQATGGFRYEDTDGRDGAGANSQVTFSRDVLPYGHLTDVIHEYPFIFYYTAFNELKYDKENTKVILVPYQYVHRGNVKII